MQRRPLSDVTNVSSAHSDWSSHTEAIVDVGTVCIGPVSAGGAKCESGRVGDLSAKNASLLSTPLDRVLCNRAAAQRYVIAVRECVVAYQSVNAQLSRANADLVARERQTQRKIKVATFRAERLSAINKTTMIQPDVHTVRAELAMVRADLRRADELRAAESASESASAAHRESALTALNARIDALESALAESQRRAAEFAASAASSAEFARVREFEADSARRSACELADAYDAAQETADALIGIVARLHQRIDEETAAVTERITAANADADFAE